MTADNLARMEHDAMLRDALRAAREAIRAVFAVSDDDAHAIDLTVDVLAAWIESASRREEVNAGWIEHIAELAAAHVVSEHPDVL